jgi:hypothetical protein
LFNIRGGPAHFDSKGLLKETLERDGVPVGGPQLELGVGLGPQLQQRVLAPVVQLDAADRLGVAPIQAFREPQNGGERANRAAAAAGKRT